MIAAARVGGGGASSALLGRDGCSPMLPMTMLPVDSGSPNSAGSNLEATPLAGKETKRHGMIISDSRAVSCSSRSGGSVIGAAMCGDGLSMIQVPSRGAGNGLDSASGTATKKTRIPHNAPASRTAEWEMRSAEITARSARMITPAYCQMMMVPSPGPQQGSPVPTSSAMVVEQDYYRV